MTQMLCNTDEQDFENLFSSVFENLCHLWPLRNTDDADAVQHR